jgi:hypothetical protein
VDDLAQALDKEAERDAAIFVAFDLLGGVPGGFGDEFRGFAGESDLNLIGFLSPINTPSVTEVGLEVEIGGNHGRGVERPEGLEPCDPVRLGLVGTFVTGDQVPGLLDQAEAIWMELDSLGFEFVGAGVIAGQTSALDERPLDSLDRLVVLAMVGELEIEDRGHSLDLSQQFGGFFLGGDPKLPSHRRGP